MLLELLTPNWQGTLQSGDAPATLNLLADFLRAIPEARVTLAPSEPREARTVSAARAHLVAVGIPPDRVLAVVGVSSKRGRRRAPFGGVG